MDMNNGPINVIIISFILLLIMQVLSFKLNVGHFPHLADLVTRINYNYFYMSDSGNLITAPGSETVASRLGKSFARTD